MASNNSRSTSSLVEAAIVGMLAQDGNYSDESKEAPSTAFEDQSVYYNEGLLQFIYGYRQVHGGLSLGICVFGIVANVLNIIVLSR